MKRQTLPGFCASGGVRATKSIVYPSQSKQTRKNVFISPARYVHLGTNIARKGMAKRTKMISFPIKSLQDTGRRSCNAFYSSGKSSESLLSSV